MADLFYLKKIIGMALMPIPLTMLLTLTGLVLLKRWPRTGKGLIALALLWLGLTSWHPVANRLLAPLEDNYPVFNLQQPVSTVVVLGSCHASDDSVPLAAQLCSSALFRLLEGLRILAANPQAELFVSGYAGPDVRPHADVLREVAISLGVSPDRIHTFPEARDTADEASLMAPLLGDKPFALISEAAHLPRAMVFFQHQGLHPIAAPAVKLSSPQPDWRIEARAAYKSERAVYEALGLIWQWLRGYSRQP